LEQARAGSQQALGSLFDGLRNYLLLIANQELPPDLQGKLGASDLVQETFLEAHRDFPQFQGQSEAELQSWLRQILQHNLSNATRHYRATDKRQLAREVSLASLAEPLAERDSPSASLQRQERDLALAAALARLPDDYRQVIAWRNYERLSFQEIGERLQRSHEAARKLWVRALALLQEHLQAHEAT